MVVQRAEYVTGAHAEAAVVWTRGARSTGLADGLGRVRERAQGSHLSHWQCRATCPGERQTVRSPSCGLRGESKSQDIFGVRASPKSKREF